MIDEDGNREIDMNELKSFLNVQDESSLLK